MFMEGPGTVSLSAEMEMAKHCPEGKLLTLS